MTRDRPCGPAAGRLLEAIIARSGFEIAEAEHSPDGIVAAYLLRAV